MTHFSRENLLTYRRGKHHCYAGPEVMIMNNQAIIERFILDDLLQGGDRHSIEMDEPLISTGVIGSLAMLRLITFLEQEMAVTIADGEVLPENFETLKKIIGFVERKKAESGPRRQPRDHGGEPDLTRP